MSTKRQSVDLHELTSSAEEENAEKRELVKPKNDANNEYKISKLYVGKRHYRKTTVTVNGHPLNPRFDLWNYYPIGEFEFDWGYDGSRPAQLALALLADCLGNDYEACLLIADFRRAVVTKLDHYDWWVLYDHEIRRTVKSLRYLYKNL